MSKVYKHVVRALIMKKNKKGEMFVLLAEKKTDPGNYELPGGSIKPKEGKIRALRREIHEELSVAITSHYHFCTGVMRTTHDASLSVCVHSYTVLIQGKLRAKNEIMSYQWVNIQKLHMTNIERKTKIILWLYCRFGELTS